MDLNPALNHSRSAWDQQNRRRKPPFNIRAATFFLKKKKKIPNYGGKCSLSAVDKVSHRRLYWDIYGKASMISYCYCMYNRERGI